MKKIPLKILAGLFAIIIILIANMLIYGRIAEKISEGPKITYQGNNKPALLVIDIQEATTGIKSSYDSYIEAAPELIAAINKQIESFKKKNIPVIFITNEVANPLVNFLNNSMEKGSVGTAIDNRLEYNGHEHFFKRRQDSFSNKEFDQHLRELGINTLYIAGLDAAYCVKSTTLGALNRAYHVILINDLIISQTEKEKSEAFRYLDETGATIINSDEIHYPFN